MGLYFEEYNVGDKYSSKGRTVREADIQQFAGLSGDYNPLHTDDIFAKNNTVFGKIIAHGALIFAISTGMYFQLGLSAGTTMAFMGTDIVWKHPVFVGDTIHLEVSVLEKRPTSKADRGIVILQRNIINQDGELCMETTATLMVKRKG